MRNETHRRTIIDDAAELLELMTPEQIAQAVAHNPKFKRSVLPSGKLKLWLTVDKPQKAEAQRQRTRRRIAQQIPDECELR